MERENVSMGKFCFCFSQESPADKGQKDGREFSFVELDDYVEPDWDS